MISWLVSTVNPLNEWNVKLLTAKLLKKLDAQAPYSLTGSTRGLTQEENVNAGLKVRRWNSGQDTPQHQLLVASRRSSLGCLNPVKFEDTRLA